MKVAKISQFSPSTLKALRIEMDEAFAIINKKYGIKLTTGNASYTAETATFKVEAATISDSGTVITKEAQAFEQYKESYKLAEFSVGQTIKLQGKDYTIMGLKPRTKAPVILGRLGKSYKVTVDMFKQYNL